MQRTSLASGAFAAIGAASLAACMVLTDADGSAGAEIVVGDVAIESDPSTPEMMIAITGTITNTGTESLFYLPSGYSLERLEGDEAQMVWEGGTILIAPPKGERSGVEIPPGESYSTDFDIPWIRSQVDPGRWGKPISGEYRIVLHLAAEGDEELLPREMRTSNVFQISDP